MDRGKEDGMNFVSATLLYLLISRLAIVSAGIVSMVIGYQLFCRGIGAAHQAKDGSNIDAALGSMKFSMKNTGPGTAFALFGAVLISVMLIQSSPAVAWESVRKLQSQPGEKPTTQTDQFQARGTDPTSIGFLTNLGRELENRGKNVEAERAYSEAVAAMAEPMNDLAWIYLNSGRAKEARGLATIAVQLRPSEQRFLHTLAKANIAAK